MIHTGDPTFGATELMGGEDRITYGMLKVEIRKRGWNEYVYFWDTESTEILSVERIESFESVRDLSDAIDGYNKCAIAKL